jgi:hypothetical protein
MSQQSATKAGRAIGAMFLAFFGSGWLIAWCMQAFGASIGILTSIVAGGFAIFFIALRQFRKHRAALYAQANPEHKRTRRIFKALNIAQWVSIAIIAVVLSNTGNSKWIPAAIIFVVGLHFLPLAAVFRYRWHYITGSALILLALMYPFLSSAGPASPSGLFGAGVILWVSALWALTARTK